MKMIQLVCLIMGIVYAAKRPRYAQIFASAYPGLDPTKVMEWRRLELRSIDAFLWASWGTFGLGLLLFLPLGAVLGANGVSDPGSSPVTIVLGFAMGALFLGGLIVSAIAGEGAKKLRRELGLKGPR